MPIEQPDAVGVGRLLAFWPQLVVQHHMAHNSPDVSLLFFILTPYLAPRTKAFIPHNKFFFTALKMEPGFGWAPKYDHLFSTLSFAAAA